MPELVYSVNEVIASLGELTGKRITVRGMLAVRFENHSLGHWPESERRARTDKLWVNFHHAALGTKEKHLKSFDGLHVLATGYPDASRKGHLRSCRGSFTIWSMIPVEYHEPPKPERARSAN